MEGDVQVTKKTRKLIFIKAVSFAEVTTDYKLTDKIHSELRVKFSMREFSEKLTQSLKDYGVDLSAGFVDSGSITSRETLRVCMQNMGANGEAPKSLMRRFDNSDGPAFNLAFVDELSKVMYFEEKEIVCVFVHESGTPHKMLHHVDLSTAQKLWNAGYAELENSGDILVVEYTPKGPAFEYKVFKEI
ncbi:MAG: hypothetical protein KBD26_03065 [Candidatus Pacebacteria bacterium]|nr:hypothetical protein [Candidatus Paceibacterota bacterium]